MGVGEDKISGKADGGMWGAARGIPSSLGMDQVLWDAGFRVGAGSTLRVIDPSQGKETMEGTLISRTCVWGGEHRKRCVEKHFLNRKT